jgi:hypothetical protein
LVAGDNELAPKSIRIVENRITIGHTILPGTPKSKPESKPSNRTLLPLPNEVVDVLKAARKRQLEERLPR